MYKDVYTPCHIRNYFLLIQVLRTCIPKDYISTKMTLNNYDDLHTKLVVQFSINTPSKRSSTKLFGLTWADDDSS
jgi:hypothetical protein